MAVLLSNQLDNLIRERERLEEVLMLDANWRALRVLETQAASGDAIDDATCAGLRAELERALAGNRIFAARAKLHETIELLASQPLSDPTPSGIALPADPGTLASRIVLLGNDMVGTFRSRSRMKGTSTAKADGKESVEGSVNPSDTRTAEETTRQPTSHHLMTADELAESLAASCAPPPLPIPASDCTSRKNMDGAPLTQLSRLRRRPPCGLDGAQKSSVLPGEDEVVVVTGPHACQVSAASSQPGAARRGLVQRFRALQPAEHLDGRTYAGYRGTVEEASVNIVNGAPEACHEPEKPRSGADRQPCGSPASRFLRALMGRR